MPFLCAKKILVCNLCANVCGMCAVFFIIDLVLYYSLSTIYKNVCTCVHLCATFLSRARTRAIHSGL